MNYEEFNQGFDILYNNITSNQAPGLIIYEKSLFCTKAEYEIVRNHFNASSKGNTTGQGFDDSAIRQADFSSLMDTKEGTIVSDATSFIKSHSKGKLYSFPTEAYIIINETYRFGDVDLQVIPLRYDEYTRLMSKPFKRPTSGQAWRIIGSGDTSNKVVELVAAPEYDSATGNYIVRFIRKPKPIILGELDGLKIDGYEFGDPTVQNPYKIKGCELDTMLHDQILQRAVELAKIAWTQTGQDNTQAVLQAGQLSE